MSSTNVPCSLVTPLYGKLAAAPLLQIYENFHKTYTFRRVVARVVVRVVVAENKENLSFVFFTNNYPSNYPCPKCVFSYTFCTNCKYDGNYVHRRDNILCNILLVYEFKALYTSCP